MVEVHILLTAVAFKVLTAVLACFGIWLVLRVFDRLANIKFKEVFTNANTEMQLFYISARLIAFGYVFATVFAYG